MMRTQSADFSRMIGLSSTRMRGIIDRTRFLDAIKSGSLSHEVMDSQDVRVRIYGNTALVTALTTTNGKFMGQEFTTKERATDVFVRDSGRWRCVITHLTRFSKK